RPGLHPGGDVPGEHTDRVSPPLRPARSAGAACPRPPRSRPGNEATTMRNVIIAALGPMLWGTTYLVTTEYLPPDRPLLISALRARPVGLLLLAASRRLPAGVWWWRSLLLGLLNFGLFFPLLFMAAYRLPCSSSAAKRPGSTAMWTSSAWTKTA